MAPLRQRPQEILALAEAFMVRCTRSMGLPAKRLGAEARCALTRHRWPGNVRELKNVIERALLLAHGPELEVADLGLDQMHAIASLAESASIRDRGAAAGDGPAASTEGTLHDHVVALERERILTMLDSCGGNRSETARRLGISRGTLLARLDQYGAPRPRRPITTE